MATDPQVHWAMIGAAASLLGRRLPEREQENLIDDYDRNLGSRQDRVFRAVARACGLTAEQIDEMRRSDAQMDQVLRELEELVAPDHLSQAGRAVFVESSG